MKIIFKLKGCLLGLIFILGVSSFSFAQKATIKTNALYWATTTVNLGTEIGLGPKSTLNLSGAWNPWEFKNDKTFKHWMVSPEFRWYMKDRFNGHFLGLNMIYGQGELQGFNMFVLYKSISPDVRYKGWMTSAALSYGYQWAIGKHWNMEATVALGLVYMNYDAYNPVNNMRTGSGDKLMVLPTKLALNFIYVF